MANGAYQCTSSNQKSQSFASGVYYEIFPGSPAVCGHGNREFSFLARRGADETQVLVVFVTGGMCWDADSCGLDASLRTMAVDNQVDKAPAVPESFPAELGIYESRSSARSWTTTPVLPLPRLRDRRQSAATGASPSS